MIQQTLGFTHPQEPKTADLAASGFGDYESPAKAGSLSHKI